MSYLQNQIQHGKLGYYVMSQFAVDNFFKLGKHGNADVTVTESYDVCRHL